ncbi:peptidylprolyl isomerase [Blautia ammoniilytica]|uniref:Peptidyl-prolyl cis-trans isomerase n=1 Tax=Blautia ammoniilytica TaxID=2981782 RepID=A0ABT2TTX8_9FIRM|nr:peptidylprolyl isomerase [uncultured Blautia sp.]MCU6765630.1 peptidylprolyl isomerase [Blautia ammoniilytica]SCI15693.1 Peptidyl-prolyl cis-trans isomerase A precursor [uncultured Blautia sp.]
MKRKYLAVLCAAVLSACMFTGCGNKDTDNKETAKTASEEQQGTEKDAEKAGISDGSDTEDVQEGSQEEGQSGQPVEDAEDAAEETSQEPEKAADTGSSEDVVTLDVSKSLTGTHDVEIKVKDYGTIDVQLDADTAPITVTNFIKLVQENFYDGLTFHRIMDGFMIQGGDPLGNGTGGSDQTIKGEFKNNKVENNISHKRGVISMARSSDPDSASSQFFIVQTDSTFLDGDYAAFGEVTSGMDVVDAICKDAKPTDDNGTIPADQQPVIEYIKVLD